MLVFKKLQNAFKEVENNLNLYQSSSNLYAIEQAKYQALKEILAYVKSYSWLKRQDAIEKVKSVLVSNFNYAEVAKKFGVSVNSLYVTLNYASKALENKIGANTIDLILQGKVEEGLTQFRVGVGKLDLGSLFIRGVEDYLPQANNSVYVSVLDCGRELKILKGLTNNNLQKIFQSLDSEKLAYLRYILTSSDGRYATIRSLLVRYLLGELSYDEFEKIVKSINVYEG